MFSLAIAVIAIAMITMAFVIIIVFAVAAAEVVAVFAMGFILADCPHPASILTYHRVAWWTCTTSYNQARRDASTSLNLVPNLRPPTPINVVIFNACASSHASSSRGSTPFSRHYIFQAGAPKERRDFPLEKSNRPQQDHRLMKWTNCQSPLLPTPPRTTPSSFITST